MRPAVLAAVAHLSDEALLARVKTLAARERVAAAALVAHLAELDARRLYLAEGCSSLFTYCTQVLRLSEHAAYGRIEAARAARRFPVVPERLAEGSVNLTTLGLLAPHLTTENHAALLEAARGKTKREVEELVAAIRPRLAVPASVRRLPVPRLPDPRLPVLHAPSPAAAQNAPGEAEGTVTPSAAGAGDTPASPVLTPPQPAVPPPPPPPRRAEIVPLAPRRYKVSFTATAETVEKLRRAQALLRHQIPDGDPAAIIDRALSVLLRDLLREKIGAADHPRAGPGRAPGSRHIPAEVKRAVWLRDGGRCAFISRNGRRCAEEAFLEFHHVRPYAAGGPPTVDNIELRCRAHNGYEAEQHFGPSPRSTVRETRAAYRTSGNPWSSTRGPLRRTRSGPDRVRPRERASPPELRRAEDL